MYKAFLSYKHPQEDFGRIFVARLESALKRYAKPLLRPPMRVFRDEVNLRPGADLSSLIRRGLEQSEYLILLASPSAAQSRWVADELELWFDELRRPPDKLVIVLVEGRIAVGRRDGHAVIDWERTNALPTALRQRLTGLPLWVDFSGFRSEAELNLDNADFKAGINRIVACLRNVDPETMLGEELAQHRRNVRIRNGTIGLLAMLAVVAVIAGLWAQRAEDRAEHEALRQRALQSAAAAEREFERAPQASLAGAIDALAATERPLPAVERTLRRLLRRPGGEALGRLPGGVEVLLLSADGSAVAAAGGRAAYYWKVREPAAPGTAHLLGEYAGSAYCATFSPSARFVALASRDVVRVWELREDGAALVATVPDPDVQELEFGDGDSWLAVRGYDEAVRVPLSAPARTPVREATGSRDGGPVARPGTGTTPSPAAAQCGLHWQALSPDGSLLLIEDDETAGFRRLAGEGEVPEAFLAFNDRLVWGGFSADGAYAAVLTHQSRVLKFRATRSAAEIATVGDVSVAAWHPTSPLLAVAHTDHRIEVRRLYTAGTTVLHGHDAAVTEMSFSATGSLATGDADGAVLWWPAPADELPSADAKFAGRGPRRGASEMPLRGVFRNEGPLIAFSPDGARIARAVDLGGHMALVIDDLPDPRYPLSADAADAPDLHERLLDIWPHEEGRDDLAPEWARQPFARWWQHQNGRRDPDRQDEAEIRTLDEAIAAARHVLVARRTLPDRALQQLAAAGLDRDLLGPAVLAGMSTVDRRWLALAGSSERFGLWQRDGDAVSMRATGTVVGIPVLRFSDDGRWFALGGEGSDVLLFDLDDVAAPARLPGHGSSVSAIAFSPEGDRLATAGDNGALLVWHLDAAAPDEGYAPLALDYDGDRPIEELAISAGARWLVAIDTGWNATAWSLAPDVLVERALRRIARPLAATGATPAAAKQ